MEASTQETAHTPDEIPTPKEYIEQAVDILSATHKKLNAAVAHLNDGIEFFNTLDGELKRNQLKSIADFTKRAQFTVSKLHDEVLICLGSEVPEAENPVLELASPTCTPFLDETDRSPENLKKTLGSLGFLLSHVSTTEFPGHQGLLVFETLQYLMKLREQISAELDVAEETSDKEKPKQ